MRKSFMEKLARKREEGKYVCLGLDTDPAKISKKIEAMLRKEFALPPHGTLGPLRFYFNKEIIDETKDLVACYKLNRAFYEGYNGLVALQLTVNYLRQFAPDVPWIWDAKYGDVGNTCKKYAQYALEELNADAATVNFYGGPADGIDAFFEYEDKGVFVWCHSSNAGAAVLQELITLQPYFHPSKRRHMSREGWLLKLQDDAMAMYERLALGIFSYCNENHNCGVVVGATHPLQLRKVRKIVGNMPILIPGIGTQGGDLRESVKAAIYTDLRTGKKSLPAIFNSSRGIIYASGGRDFAEAARRKTQELDNKIKEILRDVV